MMFFLLLAGKDPTAAKKHHLKKYKPAAAIRAKRPLKIIFF
jgi:hypothetical protein